jgi:triacylglycerol lipase
MKDWRVRFCLFALAVLLIGLIVYTILRNPGTVGPPKPVDPPKPVSLPLDALGESWDAADEKLPWYLIEKLAELSSAVYEDGTRAETLSQEIGFDTAKASIAGADTAWVCRRKNDIVIVFRGTDSDSIEDWLRDGKFAMTSVTKGRMHLGFWQGWQNLKPLVMEQLDLSDRNRRIWLCGHSLGGGLAVACAEDLEFKHDFRVKGVVTFGQPSIVNYALAKEWSKTMRSRLLRLVNKADVVPRVPPGYTFFGSVCWFTDDVPLIARTNWGPGVYGAQEEDLMQSHPLEPMSQEEYRQLKNSLEDRKRRRIREKGESGVNAVESGWSPIGDHSMNEYLAQLRRIIRNVDAVKRSVTSPTGN